MAVVPSTRTLKGLTATGKLLAEAADPAAVRTAAGLDAWLTSRLTLSGLLPAPPAPLLHFPGAVLWDPAAGPGEDAGAADPCEDGEAVAGWRSATGSRLAVPPAAGDRPVWHAGGGAPYVRFNGARYLGRTDLPAGGVLFLAAFRTTDLAGCTLLSALTAGQYGPHLAVSYLTGTLAAYDPAAGTLVTAGSVADGQWHTTLLWHGPAGAGRALWVDGELEAEAASNATAYPGQPVVLAGADDGAGGATARLVGDLARFGVAGNVPAKPSAEAVAAATAWLSTGLT